jgi:CRISPR/Cas system-associated protein Csm6
MKIKIISEESHAKLLNIQENNPILTLQNRGYESIEKSKLSLKDKERINEVEEILKKAIVGFVSFQNFRLSNSAELQIRLQYNYNYEKKVIPFTGVGYILVDELLHGFTD